MAIRLEVQDGPNVRSVRIPRAEGVLGRSRRADVQIAGRGVSRKHARVCVVGDAVEVVDLGSRAGVMVRGQRVPRALVSVGESFTVGGARITLVEASSGDQPTRATLAPARDAPCRRPPKKLVAPPHVDRSRAAVGNAPTPSTDTRAAGHLDFDELLYGVTRRTPWYLISIGLHLTLFAILTVVELQKPPPPPPETTVALSNGSAANALDDTISELVVPDVLEAMDRLVPDDSEDSPFDPVPVRVDEDPLLDEPIPSYEALASPIGVLDPSATPIGILPSSIGGMRLGTSFGKDQAGEANTLAAQALQSSPFTRQLLKGLRLRSSRVNIRVLGGEYDHCESVLERLGIEHDTLLPGELALAAPGKEIRAILYNCSSKPLSETALNHLERFVADGGYLFTTDWGLENVLERRFSQYVRPVRVGGRMIMTDDETISFQATAKHPLLRGLPDTSYTSRWWLDDASQLIDIVNPRAVDVLIESRELDARHGSGVVAVTFEHGKGRVVHVLGHFFQKEGNLRGTVAMQRILLNFLYQALREG